MSGNIRSIWDIESEDLCSGTSSLRNSVRVLPQFILNENVIRACKVMGFPEPNKVQLNVLPYFMKPYCEDLVISSPPHTGKTSSVILGILNNFVEEEKHSIAILLAPTYDIAKASYACCETLARFCNVIVQFPSKIKDSKVDIKKRKTIFVGTTEKILECSRSSVINLGKVSFFLIDEADCLGNPKKYFDDILQIHRKLNKSCRTIMCTSSLNRTIDDFAETHFYNPINISVNEEVIRKYPIERVCLVYDSRFIESKVKSLEYLISMKCFQGQMVIFCKTKEKASELMKSLQENGVEATALTGLLSHSQRENVKEDFKKALIKVVITTRSFVSALSLERSTKLVHYDQELDEKQKLDVNAYRKRELILSKFEKCVEVFFIEDNWVAYLFDENDLVGEKSYLKNLRKIPCDEIKTYYT